MSETDESKSLSWKNTDLIEAEMPACSVEWLSDQQLLAVGCYELVDGETSERKGKIEFYSIDEHGKYKKEHDLQCAAILDMKYDQTTSKLYAVDSNGFISVVNKEKKIEKSFQTTQGLCLSLAIKDTSVAISSSVGSISIVDKQTLEEMAWMGVHDDAEAWIVALGPNETMFTGGDDSTFCLWDLKSHETIVRKKFMCGQTSCEWSPVNENIIAQGGYDDTIRLWDTRNWKSPLEEQNLGGGVWRTRWNKDGTHLVVPCMYENCRLIQVDSSHKMKELEKSDCHSSISYGGCWIEEKSLISTCSFYDKKVALWSFS